MQPAPTFCTCPPLATGAGSPIARTEPWEHQRTCPVRHPLDLGPFTTPSGELDTADLGFAMSVRASLADDAQPCEPGGETLLDRVMRDA